MRHLRFLSQFSRSLAAIAVIPVAALSLIMGAAIPAGAQSLDQIAATIDQDGSYLELELQGVASDAVDRANDDGVGFVYLDQENAADLPILTGGLLDRLDALGSPYRTLIVLDASGVWVESLDRDASGASDAATPQFATGAVAGGIDTVLDVLGGGNGAAAPDNNAAGSDATDSDAAGAAETSSGGGVPWLLILFLGLAAFLAVRFLTGRKRKEATLEAELEEDRAEIREQLRNNSDHVIDLGDRIATADDDLRRMYEEAAQTFQDVSMGLDDAATAVEIDALDDRLDRAAWQFDVIEARLDGRTPPSEPTIGEGPVGRPVGRQPVPPLGGEAPPPPGGPRQPTGRSSRPLGRDETDSRPALGDDESIFDGGSTSGSSRRRRPAPQRRSRGGGLGGMLGGLAKTGLLSLVMKMLLGGGLKAGGGSRRTQQRRGSSGGGYSGGVGGGVLR